MTTNTHIAAHVRRVAQLMNAMDYTDTIEAANLLRDYAQALEAAPALDAQGEAPSWHVNFIERGWVNPVVEVLINNKTIGRFHDFGPVREVLPKVLDAALRAWSAPPPPAVGKPLSEEQILEIAKDPFYAPCMPWWLKDEVILKDVRLAAISFARAIERAHGIVTKETGT